MAFIVGLCIMHDEQSEGGASFLGVLPSGGGVVSQHALRQTPPINRITDGSKNITLATTSLRPVKIQI